MRFAGALKYYTSRDVEFINAYESRHAERLEEKGELGKIIGRIDDVEIVFLHYQTRDEAKEKWERRCSRINWNNLYLKFSQMNCCTENDLVAFESIPFNNKICFTANPRPDLPCAIYFPGYETGGGILNDTDYYARYLNLEKWLNGMHEDYCLG